MSRVPHFPSRDLPDRVHDSDLDDDDHASDELDDDVVIEHSSPTVDYDSDAVKQQWGVLGIRFASRHNNDRCNDFIEYGNHS